MQAESVRAMFQEGRSVFRVHIPQERYVLKITDRNEMNHPEQKPLLCAHLAGKGIPVPRYVSNREGGFLTVCDEELLAAVYRYAEDTACLQNSAPA